MARLSCRGLLKDLSVNQRPRQASSAAALIIVRKQEATETPRFLFQPHREELPAAAVSPKTSGGDVER